MSWSLSKDDRIRRRLLSTFKRLGLIKEIRDGREDVFYIVPV